MGQRNSTARISKVQTDSACSMCGRSGITTSWNRHSFIYGSGESAIELTVSVPVRRCEICEFDYLDEVAQQLKHEAVCQHLGVLTPSEIRRIREDHGMTRASFAQVTGLGAASLNRWENGLTIQTYANDRYLRLLSRPDIMRKLEELLAHNTPHQTPVIPLQDRFPTLTVTDTLLLEKERFQLRKTA